MSTSTSRLKLRTVKLDRLRLSANNPKEHSAEQIEQLRQSIRRFGFNDPIGVDGNMVILEGEGRYHAALAEGLTEVPVVRIDHLTERERQAYRIAHNQTQRASGLDMTKLNAELVRLEVGVDDYPSLGFSTTDVMFLAPDPVIAASGGEEGEGAAWNDLITPIIKTQLKFSSEVQFGEFVGLLKQLEARYPDEPTPQARLLRFSREFGA